MRSLVLGVLLVGCVGDNTEPIEFRLDLVFPERGVRPAPSVMPRTFIDGIERSILDLVYENPENDITKHIVELRFSNTAIRTLGVSLDTFGQRCKSDGVVRSIEQTICVYDSGDLRFGSETVDDSCVADAACRPACQPLDGCAVGRCTSYITSTEPLASYLGCAPIGVRQIGQSCGYVPTPDGLYDDCGEHLLCVNGRCRATCGSDGDCTGCANVPGHAVELRVCPL